jgi:hypothetical protein
MKGVVVAEKKYEPITSTVGGKDAREIARQRHKDV